MTDMPILAALVPVVVLLALGIATAIGSRALGLSPIVGYIALGIGLKAVGVRMVFEEATISLLAELGVVFLLFDVGLHFSLKHMRERASDIFAFGPVQVLLATLVLGLVGLLFGLSPLPAFLVGAVLSMSSTAVVARLIAERHQQSCPVGQTATAILVFQDVAAIFLLIVVGSLNSTTALALVTALALAKAVAAFGASVLIARLAIGPLLALVAGTRNEEVFTATALVIALAAGWATGQIGLSLTLGAFLGGLTLSETPYRAVIQAEITPFRGLLLSFFFIYVGFSLDAAIIAQYWYAVLGIAALFVAAKVMTNIAASLVFRWSVPGSTQLGFLLSQGSEFAFVILSLPAVRTLVGESRASILVAAVALSMAATPNLAEIGRSLAGSMRRRRQKAVDLGAGAALHHRAGSHYRHGKDRPYRRGCAHSFRHRLCWYRARPAPSSRSDRGRLQRIVRRRHRHPAVGVRGVPQPQDQRAHRAEARNRYSQQPGGGRPIPESEAHRGRGQRVGGGTIPPHRRPGGSRARQPVWLAPRGSGFGTARVRCREDRRMHATA